MLTQHCDTGIVLECATFLGQINVAKWSQPRVGTDHDQAHYNFVDLWIHSR